MKHSELPFIDTQKLFLRVLYYFLIGNGDAHLKNFAMIRLPNLKYRLSPAYDIVSSKLVMENEIEETALRINGKKNKITLKDFKALAEYLQINAKQYERHMANAKLGGFELAFNIQQSFLPQGMKDRFETIFEERYRRIFP